MKTLVDKINIIKKNRIMNNPKQLLLCILEEYNKLLKIDEYDNFYYTVFFNNDTIDDFGYYSDISKNIKKPINELLEIDELYHFNLKIDIVIHNKKYNKEHCDINIYFEYFNNNINLDSNGLFCETNFYTTLFKQREFLNKNRKINSYDDLIYTITEINNLYHYYSDTFNIIIDKTNTLFNREVL